MKTKLFVIAFLFWIFIPVIKISAQINLSKKKDFANDLCIIGNISGGAASNVLSAIGSGYSEPVAEHKIYARVFQDKLTIGILVYTANHFDDAMEVALGTNISTSLESISDIIEWYTSANMSTSITFTDIDGREVMLSKEKYRLQMKILKNVNGSIVSDNAYFTDSNLNRAYNMIKDVAPEKIYNFMKEAGMDDHEYVIEYEDGKRAEEKKKVELQTILDKLKPEMDAIKDSIRAAKKLKDTEKVKLLTDSLDVIKSNYQIIFQHLHPTTADR